MEIIESEKGKEKWTKSKGHVAYQNKPIKVNIVGIQENEEDERRDFWVTVDIAQIQ